MLNSSRRAKANGGRRGLVAGGAAEREVYYDLLPVKKFAVSHLYTVLKTWLAGPKPGKAPEIQKWPKLVIFFSAPGWPCGLGTGTNGLSLKSLLRWLPLGAQKRPGKGHGGLCWNAVSLTVAGWNLGFAVSQTELGLKLRPTQAGSLLSLEHTGSHLLLVRLN